MSKILVIAEHLGGKLNPSTARAVSAAAAVKPDAIDVLVLSDNVGAIAADADPAIEQRIFGQIAWQWRRAGIFCSGSPRRQTERDNKGAGTRHRCAARQDHRHWPFSGASGATAITRRIAAMMRKYVPQRQRLGSIQARMSSSVAAGLAANSAWARMIMPALQ